MRNGQLKPGYNVQIGTEDQFILSYSIHQRPTDTRCLKPHLDKVKASLGELPGTIITDAGYGSEENYAYLESEEQRALVKYNTYHKENTKAWKQDISKFENWLYDENEDSWTCAAGQKLLFRYESKSLTESGYEIVTRNYRSISCEGCPLKGQVYKGTRRSRNKGQHGISSTQAASERATKERGWTCLVGSTDA